MKKNTLLVLVVLLVLIFILFFLKKSTMTEEQRYSLQVHCKPHPGSRPCPEDFPYKYRNFCCIKE